MRPQTELRSLDELRNTPILLPSVFGPVEGRAGSWAPIGLVIMGGLTTSTFLTLVIIPTLYSLLDDMTNFFKRVAAGVRRTPEPVGLEVAES